MQFEKSRSEPIYLTGVSRQDDFDFSQAVGDRLRSNIEAIDELRGERIVGSGIRRRRFTSPSREKPVNLPRPDQLRKKGSGSMAGIPGPGFVAFEADDVADPTNAQDGHRRSTGHYDSPELHLDGDTVGGISRPICRQVQRFSTG